MSEVTRFWYGSDFDVQVKLSVVNVVNEALILLEEYLDETLGSAKCKQPTHEMHMHHDHTD